MALLGAQLKCEAHAAGAGLRKPGAAACLAPAIAAAMLLSACGGVTPSLVDPLKGNRPYDAAEEDEPLDLREGKPVYIWPISSPDGRRILFVSSRDGNSELYVMKADGTEPVNLTRNRAEDGDGSYGWSPDGEQIVFSSKRSGSWNVYTVKPDGRDLRRVTDSSAQDYNPVWSPDGAWLAFASNRSGRWQIYRVRPDGTGLEALTESAGDNDAPVYSPDGSSLAFISDRNGNWDIYRMPSSGGPAVALTDYPSDEDHPRWSTDGRRIIFESNKDGHWDVYSMGSDGSDLVRLTETPAAESSPVYSPDMKQVAFASYRDGNPEIYVMEADGSNPTRLTFNPANDICPYWSPDGTRIYFSSNRGGREEIFAIRMSDHKELAVSAPGGHEGAHETGEYYEEHPVWSPDGARLTFRAGTGDRAEWFTMDLAGGRMDPARDLPGPFRTVIPDFGPVEHPVVSPDGKWMVFESKRDGNWELYLASINGSDARRLTESAGADTQPAWSPDGNQIAFTSLRGGRPGIYIMDRVGNNVRAVETGAPAQLAAWSADGMSLFFVSGGDDRNELRRIDLETGRTQTLARPTGASGGRIWHPTASPDGRWVAFIWNSTGQYRVWVSDPEGKALRLLTPGVSRQAMFKRPDDSRKEFP